MVRLVQHSRSDMAAAIRNENYGLTIVKSWPCIGRFALHALEAAEICTLKSGESSGPRGYLAANVVLPTTKETLCQQLADRSMTVVFKKLGRTREKTFNTGVLESHTQSIMGMLAARYLGFPELRYRHGPNTGQSRLYVVFFSNEKLSQK